MISGQSIDQINQRTMRSVVEEYLWTADLEPQERAALESIVDQVRGKRILDIGVGAGRTVRGLRAISTDYVGVDYVQEMVTACRTRFPDARFELADARAMPEFSDNAFDLVVFACNGICMVDHDGRMRILREVHRVLAPGGYFLFSTANLNNPERARLFTFPPLAISANPLKFAVRASRFAAQTGTSLVNRLRYKRHEVHTPEYAIRNDKNHRYATMIYSITLERQRAQLEAAGFGPGAQAFDLSGRAIAQDTQDGTITLIAQK